MIRRRIVLWCMLFSGVIVHMICCSNLFIAMTAMVNRQKNEEVFEPYCSKINILLNNTVMIPQPVIKDGEFDWNDAEVNTIISSFSWFMGSAQFIGGLLCQKFGGKVVFGFSNLTLGVMCFLIPIVSAINYKLLILVRIIQGIAGGAAIGNASNRLISKWVPPEERGKFQSHMSGVLLGTACSYFFHGWILHWFGWRATFYVTGSVTCIWCMFWYIMIYDSPREHPDISPKELAYIEGKIGNSISKTKLAIPWKAILTSPPVIVSTLCSVAHMWTVFTITMYVPTYLTEIHGLPPYAMGTFSSFPYLLAAVFSLTCAWATDRIIQRKLLSTTNTRKLATFLSTILAGMMFFGLGLIECNTFAVVLLLISALMLNGAAVSGVSPNLIDLSPNFCSIIHGLEGFIACSSGYLSPLLVAMLTNNNKTVTQWQKVFFVSGGVNVVPGIFFLIFGDSKVQRWNTPVESERKVEDKLLKTIENGHSTLSQ